MVNFDLSSTQGSKGPKLLTYVTILSRELMCIFNLLYTDICGPQALTSMIFGHLPKPSRSSGDPQFAYIYFLRDKDDLHLLNKGSLIPLENLSPTNLNQRVDFSHLQFGILKYLKIASSGSVMQLP